MCGVFAGRQNSQRLLAQQRVITNELLDVRKIIMGKHRFDISVGDHRSPDPTTYTSHCVILIIIDESDLLDMSGIRDLWNTKAGSWRIEDLHLLNQRSQSKDLVSILGKVVCIDAQKRMCPLPEPNVYHSQIGERLEP